MKIYTLFLRAVDTDDTDNFLGIFENEKQIDSAIKEFFVKEDLQYEIENIQEILKINSFDFKPCVVTENTNSYIENLPLGLNIYHYTLGKLKRYWECKVFSDTFYVVESYFNPEHPEQGQEEKTV